MQLVIHLKKCPTFGGVYFLIKTVITVKIPATGTPADTNTMVSGSHTGSTAFPETGNDGNIALWIVSIMAAPGVRIVKRFHLF